MEQITLSVTAEESVAIQALLARMRQKLPESPGETPKFMIPQWASTTRPHLPGGHMNSSQEPSDALMCPNKLHIQPKDHFLFLAVNRAVQAHMSSRHYDCSHDYEHILRVCSLALHIYEAELKTNTEWAKTLDPLVLFLACMMHDVGDNKYIQETDDPKVIKYQLLIACSANTEMSEKVCAIAAAVSFTDERQNPDKVQEALKQYPELAIVQDADRLDGLGAVGEARAFSCGGAKEFRRWKALGTGIQLNWSRLVHYPHMMKTATGKRMAWERWGKMMVYSKWYIDEAEMVEAVLPDDWINEKE